MTLRIVTPKTRKRTPFKKDGDTNPGSIIYSIALEVENQTGAQKESNNSEGLKRLVFSAVDDFLLQVSIHIIEIVAVPSHSNQ